MKYHYRTIQDNVTYKVDNKTFKNEREKNMAKKEQTVELKPINIKTMEIDIVGDSDLVLNKMNDVAAKSLIDARKDKAVDKTTKPNEWEEIITAIHWRDGKPTDYSEEGLIDYYEKLSEDRIALMVKLLDRCNNISGMAAAFSIERMASYIIETEEHIYPLLNLADRKFPQYR